MDIFSDYTSYSSQELYREWRWQEIRGKKFTVPLCNCPNGSGPGEPWRWHAHSRWKCQTWKRPQLPEGEPTYCNCDLAPGRTLLKYDGHWKDGVCEEHLRRRSVDAQAKQARRAAQNVAREKEREKKEKERMDGVSETNARNTSVDSGMGHVGDG